MMVLIIGMAVAAVTSIAVLLRDRYREEVADYVGIRNGRLTAIEAATARLREELGREPTVAEIYDAAWPPDIDADASPTDETERSGELTVDLTNGMPAPHSEVARILFARLGVTFPETAES